MNEGCEFMVPKDIAIKLANNPAHQLMDNDRDAYRVPPNIVFPEDVDLLKLEMSKVIHRYKDKYVAIHKIRCDQYDIVSNACDIPASSIKHMLNGRQRITRHQLGKFCVGLKLSIEEAQQLFKWQGRSLSVGEDAFDTVVYYALKDKDDIWDFIDEAAEIAKVNLHKEN